MKETADQSVLLLDPPLRGDSKLGAMKKTIGYASLTWLIPFVVSTPLIGPDGVSVIGEPLFKTVMLVLSALLSTFFMARLVAEAVDPRRLGSRVGAVFFGVNVALDALVLLPLSGMGPVDYLQSIGLRYLYMPIVAFGLAWTATRGRRAHV